MRGFICYPFGSSIHVALLVLEVGKKLVETQNQLSVYFLLLPDFHLCYQLFFFLQNLGRQSKENQYFAKKLCKPHLANVIIGNSGTLLRPKPWTSSALDICGNTPFPRPFSTVYVQCCLSIFHCTVKTLGNLKQNSSEDASPSYYLF